MKKNLGLTFAAVFSLGMIASVPNVADAHGCPAQTAQKCSASDPNPISQSCWNLHQWPTCGCVAEAIKGTPAQLVCNYDSSESNTPPPMAELPNNPVKQQNPPEPTEPTPAPTPKQPIIRPYNPNPYERVEPQAFHGKTNQAHLIKVSSASMQQSAQNDYAYYYSALVSAGYSPRRVDLEHRRLSPMEFNIWANNRINYRLEQRQAKATHDLVMDNAPLTRNGF